MRPEHLSPANGAAADFEIAVQMVETLGADTLAHGSIDGTARADMVVRLPGTVAIHEGDRLPLTVAPGHAHLFDAGSGRRL